MNYEQQQKHLEELWQEVLSDEDDNVSLFGETSDEYVPSNDEESDESEGVKSPAKRYKTSDTNVNVASTSRASCSNVNKNNAIMETIENVIKNSVDGIYSDVEEDAIDDHDDEDLAWSPVTGLNLKPFLFTESNTGVNAEIYEDYSNKTPYDFYELVVNEDILTMMVTETNRYAAQCKAKETAPRARIHDWHNTDIAEMKKIIGLIFWMGLCQYPSIESYWSRMVLYQNTVKSAMSRNRFQLMLKMWHFHDNEDVSNDRLQKVSPLLDKLIENFQRPLIPNEAVCIDETLVPFRGRLSFKQFIKNKRHKFGIKLYKLCLEKGYTYNLIVYCGQDKVKGQLASQKVVLTLADNLLNKGRTIYTDNYDTSVALAHVLLKKNTHLVGTLRSNRKLNPKDVVNKKLEKGETAAAESNTGVVVQKWKDKRDVLTLSTKHTSELVKVTYGGKQKEKPASVVDYNKNKAYIDLSDQMKAYSTSLRRGVKWYRKLAIEILIGTALVNAFVLHQEVANEKMTITKFKEEVTLQLLQMNTTQGGGQSESVQHSLEDAGSNNRRRCVVCYEQLQKEYGRAHAQSKAPRTKLKCSEYNPKFNGPIVNVTIPVGREAVIECGVDNLSTFKVAWLRVDTQTILTIHSHVITKNHRIGVTHSEHRTWYLHIRDVRESDRGWYMCQINTDPMKSQVGYLDVVVPPDILDYPTSTDMVVREGSNVSFRCAATGSPEPTIAWRREAGEPIPLGNGHEVPSVEGSIFNISKVNRLHMGPYLCIASNGVPPSVSKRIMLIVHFPPMIWIQNQLVGAYEGQQISLDCHSEAYPKSINYWTKDNGIIISQGAKYEPVMVDNAYKVHMKLTIRSVGPSDYGSYKCVSKNSLGDTDGTIKLYHIPSPSTPQKLVTTTIIPTNKPTEKDNIKQRGRQKEPTSDLSTNEIFFPESAKERDLRLRSNPSDPSSQELDAVDDFPFPSSSSQQKLLYNLVTLTIMLILCK